MNKLEAAIKYINENYLQLNLLRHDLIADKLQIRQLDEDNDFWREMNKHDINSIVCHAAQEYDQNITSREVITALQSDLIPDVHPLREYILSLKPYTPDQPDWIDFVASQVRVRESALDNGRGNAAMGRSQSELLDGTKCLLDNAPIAKRPIAHKVGVL